MRHVGAGVPAYDIECGVNRMSVHPAEFSEATYTIPQDWASLARYLARRGIVFGPAQPRQFAGGYGNLNYLIEIDGEPAVLRRPPAGPLPYGGNDMAREYRILSSLWREYPLAPRAMFFCDEASVLGAPFQIIEYRPGMVIRDSLPPGLAGRPEAGMLLSRQLVESSRCFACSRPGASWLGDARTSSGFPRPNRRRLGSSQRCSCGSDQSSCVIRGARLAAPPGAGGCATEPRSFRLQARQHDPGSGHICSGRNDRLGYGDAR